MTRSTVGVDVGGTFTDMVLFDAATGRLTVAKVPSTPANQATGVMAGLRALLADPSRLERLVHGTTVSTNALLQRTGAKVALVTTKGFCDTLEIGRTRRMLPSLYDPMFVRPPPLVERPLRHEADERILADGSVLIPLRGDDLAATAVMISDQAAEAVAVCFLHAYANPLHERLAADALARSLPSLHITTSSEVVCEFREYERCSTTVINAYLLPVMDRYLSTLHGALAAAGCEGRLFTMSSSGGTMDIDTVRRLPVRTILSGPAGGVAGSLWAAAAAGLGDCITYDMGGTSTDVCVIESGRAAMVAEIAFAGHPIKGRQISINTVGAGGGSIAFLEAGNILQVGPLSAGAEPGPACYGRGGRDPTVTDANLILGRIGTERLLGGAIRLDPDRAWRALAELGRRLGIDDVARVAEGVVQIAVARMAGAIREITLEKGHNPADFTLVAFGGAGPMHATQVADELGIGEVFVPMFPGHLSAIGLLASDQRHEHVRTFVRRLSALAPGEIETLIGAQEAEGRSLLSRQGMPPECIRFAHALDMRYARQAFEITVDLPPGPPTAAALRAAFLGCYLRHYGHADPKSEIEIVNVRTMSIGVTAKPAPARVRANGHISRAAVTARRAMVVRGERVDGPVYDRDRLAAGMRFSGPAVVEEAGATTVVYPGWTASVDAGGNLRLRAARLNQGR
ncbi:MAG: hydantoinase/oxoprolinase family protein [Pseudomonadota bacterium]